MWIKHKEDTNIPSWLSSELASECSTCGSDIENFYLTTGRNNSERCTNRRCSNPECPETLGVKISNMADIFNWKGVGAITGKKLVISNKLTNHLQAIPFISTEKPKLTLNKLLQVCFIPGLATKCDSIDTSKYSSIEEFIEGYQGEFYHDIKPYFELLREANEYVEIDTERVTFTHEPILFGNVMITGNINQLPDRELFPALVAKMTDGLVALTLVGKRKTGVMALIKEEGSAVTGKVDTAIDNNIPIMTSNEFYTFIGEKLKQELIRRGRL